MRKASEFFVKTLDNPELVTKLNRAFSQPLVKATSAVLSVWPLWVITWLSILVRALTAPAYIDSQDGLFFVRGVTRYSVVDLSPHWPGYPVYIWLGKLANLILPDPVAALHLVGIVSTTLCLWPLAAMAYDWRLLSGSSSNSARIAGLATALIWSVVPLSWINGSEIFSDQPGLFLGLVMLWVSWRALQSEHNSSRWVVAGATLGGLMLGTRLSYFPLLLPLAYSIWAKRRTLRVWLPVMAFLATITTWLGWQLVQDGLNFFVAGILHLKGHYDTWGGSVTTDHNFLSRPFRFLKTLLVYGFGGWWPEEDWLRLISTLILVGLIGSGIYYLTKNAKRHILTLIGLWTVPYALWLLVGNDVDLSRYYFPLVAIGCLLAGIGLVSLKIPAVWLLAGWVLINGVITVPLAIEHQGSPPIGHKVVDYLYANFDPNQTVIFIPTNSETPHLIPFLKERGTDFASFSFPIASLEGPVAYQEAHNNTVYALLIPGQVPKGWTPVAHFCRNRYIQSRGEVDIWLYKHQGSEAAVNLACI